MKRVPGLALLVLLMLTPRQASADITGFLGLNTTPDARPVKGGALGSGLLILGFEVEYAATDGDIATAVPSVKTGMGNVLIQTPTPVFRMQPYFTTGGGVYREQLGNSTQTGIGFNTGGGVKISLVGPLRLRLDYRLFRLGKGALQSPSHRVYAGLNLRF
jgi:opacity protein-like surface antigen